MTTRDRAGGTVKRSLQTLRRSGRLALAMAQRERVPFSVTFILTNRCNFECAYCNIPAAAAEEMTTDQFRQAIDDLERIGLARASFSGGEALLRPDALDIIEHAHDRGLVTSLNSNAWLTERHLPRLARILDMLVISLDGPESVHDLVRRRKRSYERVIRVLDAARAQGIATATITVLNEQNVHVVDEVLELAERHGFFAYFQPAYENCFDHADGLEPYLTGSRLASIADQLGAARNRGAPIGASPGYLDRLRKGPVFGDCSTCSAGRYWATVMPDGTVTPCHLTIGPDGSRPNGLAMGGFDKAFLSLEPPQHGPGCAISPYNETDLIFSLDPRAVLAAFERLRGRRLGAQRA